MNEKNKRRLTTALLVVAILAVIGWRQWNKKTPQFQENPGFRVDASGAALADAIGWARTSYPIKEVRDEFNRICLKIDSGQYQFVIDPTNPPTANAFAFTADEGGVPVIVFVGPHLHTKWRELDQELFRDYIVETILHEAHHVENHARTPDYNAEVHRNNEDDTWWYMLENVLAPMEQNGRLQNLHPRDVVAYALQVHKHINGDRTHPAWETFTFWVSRERRTEHQLRKALGLPSLEQPQQEPPPTPPRVYGPQPPPGN